MSGEVRKTRVEARVHKKLSTEILSFKMLFNFDGWQGAKLPRSGMYTEVLEHRRTAQATKPDAKLTL